MDLALIVVAILTLGVLVVVHEAGHYFAAKWGGMSVSRFSVGFGPALYKRQRGETEFRIGAIPFGGYVQIDGMHPEDGTDPESPKSYLNRPRHLRAAAVLAGPVANYLLAFAMLALFYGAFAMEGRAPFEVSSVEEGSAAAEAGLRPGDLIVGTATTAFEGSNDLVDAIGASEGAPMILDVEREGVKLTVTATARRSGGKWMLGVGYVAIGDPVPVHFGPVEAIRKAGQEVGLVTERFVLTLASLVKAPSTVKLSGPPGIVNELTGQMKRSAAGTFRFAAHLSIMLGFFNLLPIPALDGARLVFIGLGAIRRKEIEPRFEAVVHGIGFLFLLGLMLVVSYFDVMG